MKSSLNDGLLIRTVREEDAGSIIDLLNPIIETGIYTTLDRPISLNQQLDFIRNFPEDGLFHIAISEQNQKVVGIQDIHPIPSEGNTHQDIGEIATFVSLDSLRSGIGECLSEATFNRAKESGYRKLMATIRSDNPHAVSFYQSRGFRVIGTALKHAFIRGQYVDQILAEKLLD